MNPIDHLCNRSVDEDILRVALIAQTKKKYVPRRTGSDTDADATKFYTMNFSFDADLAELNGRTKPPTM